MKTSYYFFLTGMFFLIAACGSKTFEENESLQHPSSAAAHLQGAGEATAQISSNATAPRLVKPSDHGGGFGWKKERCYVCHSVAELNQIHAYNPLLAESFSKLGEADTGVCLYCHGTNGLSGVTSETYQCTFCHTDNAIAASANLRAGHNIHDMNADGVLKNSDCIICHAYSDMNGDIELAIDFSKDPATDYTNVTEFCLNCHDNNGAFGILPFSLSIESEMRDIYSTYKGMGESSSGQKQTADIHGAKNGSGQSFAKFRGRYTTRMEISCLDCHQVHSSSNPYLITEKGSSAKFADDIAKNAVVKVTENNFTQLCAVCHTSPDGAPTDNGLTEVSHSSTYSASCTDCHYHGAGSGIDNSGLF